MSTLDIKDYIRQLFRKPDGDADVMALLCVVSTISYLCTGMWSVFHNGQPFDPSAWGTGLGVLIGASAAGMGVKAMGEKGSNAP